MRRLIKAFAFFEGSDPFALRFQNILKLIRKKKGEKRKKLLTNLRKVW